MTSPGTVTSFSTGNTNGEVAVGPNGNVWFGAGGNSGNGIGEITPAGKSTVFPITGIPGGLVAGPDGALWFTDGSQIGRITTAGQVNYFAIPNYYSGGFPLSVRALEIASGSDGNLWVTAQDESGDPLVVRITPAGSVVFFPLPITSSSGGGTVEPGRIISGPDGALWFADSYNGVGRIAADGTASFYPVAAPASGPVNSVTAGPDGNIWFTTEGNFQSGAYIGKMSTAGSVLGEYLAPSGTSGASVLTITAGPDGSLWYTDEFENVVGRITTTGSAIDFPAPGTFSLGAIAPGTDGNVWFADSSHVSRAVTGAPGTNVAPPVVTGGGQVGALRTCGGAQFGPWMGATPVPGNGASWALNSKLVAGATGQSYRPPVAGSAQTLTCTASASYPSLNATVAATSAPVTLPPPSPLASDTAERDFAAQLRLAPIYGSAFATRGRLTNRLLGTTGTSCPASALAFGPSGGASAPECQTEFESRGRWYFAAATVSRTQDLLYYTALANSIAPSGTASIVTKNTWRRRWSSTRARPSGQCPAVPGLVSTNDNDGRGNDGLCWEYLLNLQFAANSANDYNFHFRKTLDDYSPASTFSPFFLMHCTLRRDLYQCLNSFGDGFRWRVAATALPGEVHVNCQHSGPPPKYKPHFTADIHPSNCDIWGLPEALANLVELRSAHWSRWNAPSVQVRGRELNTHPGMGGPASVAVTASLHRIRRGCGGLLFYTRMSFSGAHATTLRLSASCEP